MKAKIIFGTGRTTQDRYFIDGEEVTKAKFDRLCRPKGKRGLTVQTPPSTIASSHKAWPRLSDALGVSPKQRQEAQEQSIKLGVPTEFAEDGRAVLRDTAHQRDLQKALGYFNRDGGYGTITG
jgi:hypothetical protein